MAAGLGAAQVTEIRGHAGNRLSESPRLGDRDCQNK
jgi:hypothetical protein